MSHSLTIGIRTKPSVQKFRRRYERKSQQRVCRVIETLAVMLGLIFFSHLIEISRKVPNVPRQKLEARSEPVIEKHPRSGVVVTQQVALVPEPSAAMFVLLGVATIFYSRRKKLIVANPGDGASAIVQPSKMATAAA
jgi:hypothetical protein